MRIENPFRFVAARRGALFQRLQQTMRSHNRALVLLAIFTLVSPALLAAEQTTVNQLVELTFKSSKLYPHPFTASGGCTHPPERTRINKSGNRESQILVCLIVP
jgi:hypothetical protein